MLRAILTTLSEILGMLAVSAGIWLIYPPAAVIVAGACLIGIGVSQA